MKEFFKDTFSRDFRIGMTRGVAIVAAMSLTGAVCRVLARR